jgi:hypothetical protein
MKVVAVEMDLVRDVGANQDPDLVTLGHREPSRTLHRAVPERDVDDRPRGLGTLGG